MTAIIAAIRMRICRSAALMTLGNHLIADPFAQAVIKNEIFTLELILQSLLFYFIGIMNNSAFKMKYIFKPLMKQVCTGLFTADATGAVHNDVFVLIGFQHLCSH